MATVSPDYQIPATASLIQDRLGAVKAAAFDLNAACTGFVYSVTVGASLIQTGLYEHVLVIGAEALSRFVDYTDRNSCILFGDGAGAVVLSRVPEDNPSRLVDEVGCHAKRLRPLAGEEKRTGRIRKPVQHDSRTSPLTGRHHLRRL